MRKTTGTILAAALALGALGAPAAMARGGSDDPGGDRAGAGHRTGVGRAGTCTGPSTATIKVGRENRGLEVEFEVDQNRVGVPWRVVLAVNGREVVRRTVRTTGPSGSFAVRHVGPGAAGGRVSATATRVSGGEACRASAVLAAA